MGNELLNFGGVIASMLLLMVLPFLPTAFLLFRGQQWPKILFASMVLGFSLQASVGMLWSHLSRLHPLAESSVFAAVCVVLLGWAYWSSRRLKVVIWDIDAEPMHSALILILLLGFLVRSIHPLEVSYLAQSDAYTHLNYVRNIIDSGWLGNPAYPPGYHWILALPSLVFNIDPYFTARYGGAVFGVGLVLGIYVFLEQCFDRRSAVFGSFCAAAFPGMILLMKTGVGSFANQFGLLLLPPVFLFYILLIRARKASPGDHLLLAASLLGLAAAVPMMLLHVMLIFGLERLFGLLRYRKGWFTKTLKVVVLLLPALLLFMFHISQIGGGQRFRTAEIMTGYSEEKTSTVSKIAENVERKITIPNVQTSKITRSFVQGPYFKLLDDYMAIKRLGFGNTQLNWLAGTLAVCFFFLFIVGIIRAEKAHLVLGLWGLLTCLQASTGILQFSAYQREGWSLLVATCCLSGIMASFVYRYVEHLLLMRLAVIGAMAASFAWVVIHPPSHYPIWSSAENEVVKLIRFLGKTPSISPTSCGKTEDTKEQAMCDITAMLDGNLETVLVTRRFVGWGNQGEIALNVLPPDSTLPVLVVDHQARNDLFQAGRQYVVLADKNIRLAGNQKASAFAMVTPSMVELTLKSREKLNKINESIVQKVDNLDNSFWDVTRVKVSDALSVYVVVPI